MPLQEEFDDPIENEKNDSSVALFLALMLLVLAFFIIMVSISQLEIAKSKAALKSLASTFSTVSITNPQLTFVSNSQGKEQEGQQFQREITNIFSTVIQVTSAEIIKPGREMRVKLESDVLFEKAKSKVKEINHPFLDRVVATLSARPPGFRFDIEFIIGTQYKEGNVLPENQTLEMSRAGEFARAMLSRGVPPDSVTVGINPGDPKIVTIWFYVRSIEDTYLNFVKTDNVKVK